MIPATVEEVMLATGANIASATLYLPFIQGTCKAYDITTPKRVAAFLSQIGHESGGLRSTTESLNYSAEALVTMFGRHRISIEQANQYGRTKDKPADQETLANILYGGDWGKRNLGNTQPGDGWKFRGRGLKQLTGRHNALWCGNALKENFIDYPERLLMPVNAALSAGWFWDTNELNKLADAGETVALTRKVNGGLNGLKERTALYTKALEMFA